MTKMLAVASDGERAVVAPPEGREQADRVERLRGLLEAEEPLKLVRSVVEEAARLAGHGVVLRGAVGLAETAGMLLRGAPQLLPALERLTGAPLGQHSDRQEGRLSPERLWRAWGLLRPWAKEAGVTAGAILAECQAAATLGRMTARGVRVSPALWGATCEEAVLAAARAQARLARALACFPRQVPGRAAALGGEVLEQLARELHEWRAEVALARWAGEPLRGRLLPLWETAASSTGRVSSRRPNVLGLPSRLYPALVGEGPADLVVCGDWSSQEPWVLASLLGDEELAAALRRGELYQALAEEAKVPRAEAKRALLALAYGAGNERLATIGVPPTVAARWRRRVCTPGYEALAGLRPPPDRERLVALGAPLTVAEVRVPLAGRRLFLERNVPAQRNFPVQGTAAAMAKAALVGVEARLAEGALVQLVVHDELVVSCPPDAVAETEAVLAEAMAEAAARTVGSPVPVRLGAGENRAAALAAAKAEDSVPAERPVRPVVTAG
jgi:hypothetical protein